MKNLLLLSVLFISVFQSTAQNQDRQWHFAWNKALSFVSGEPVIVNGSNMYAIEACASIADNDGNLLFYTDGINVWDSNNQFMPNGTDFKSSTTPTQIVIVPFPNDSNKYYIFHFTCPDPGICIPPRGLNYSVVDMELNGGLGAIDSMQREIPVIEEILTEKVMAVKHGNGEDWWVITHDLDSTFITIPITSNGIGAPVYHTIGNGFTNMSGEMEISPNGEKLVAIDIEGFINLFDFDRCEGTLSNPQDLSKEFIFPDNSYYGCAFSPNNRVLYIAEYFKKQILQFDLGAADIAASETLVFDSSLSDGIGGMQLGPDGKIYFGMINTGLGVIEAPDVLGQDCNASLTSLYSSNIGALPTMPNYNLQEIVCETTSTEATSFNTKISIYPNPFNESSTIEWQGFKPHQLEVWDIAGRLIAQFNIADFDEKYVFQRNSLPSGFYILKVIDPQGLFESSSVIITN